MLRAFLLGLWVTFLAAKKHGNSYRNAWESDGFDGQYPGASIGGENLICGFNDTADMRELVLASGLDFIPAEHKERHAFYARYLANNSSYSGGSVGCKFKAGIEIGALHNPAPVPASCIGGMKYFDSIDQETAKKLYPELAHVIAIDFIGDANIMTGIEDESYDFLIASHVIEHMATPITAIKNWLRVLKPGGLIVMIAPNGCLTFDRFRLQSSLAHIMTEEAATDAQKQEFYLEHVREWTLSHLANNPPDRPRDSFPSKKEFEQTFGQFSIASSTKEFQQRGGMHFHVWSRTAMIKFLLDLSSSAAGKYKLPMKVVAAGFLHENTMAVIEKI